MFPLGLLFEQLKRVQTNITERSLDKNIAIHHSFLIHLQNLQMNIHKIRTQVLCQFVFPEKKDKHLHNFHSLPNGRWNLQSLMNPGS